MNSEKFSSEKTLQNILVVDDEPQVCDLLKEALTYMGHRVETASNGQEALERLNENFYSIVIADMDMPVMDGMELIRRIVEEDRNGVDVIAITGHSMRYKYTDVVAAGAVDFIIKPFTLNELEAKLNRIIRERYMRQELERLAVRDPLTGLYNRRYFSKVVLREAVRSIRYHTSLFLLYLDIDNFKEYNDQQGHQAGDRLLVRLAELLLTSIRREVDSAFRFGGDEFTVLLPYLKSEYEVAMDQALMVAKRIQYNYKQLELEPTSLSIGLALFRHSREDVGEDIDDMIHRADRALYRAKSELGGDSICCDGK